MIDRRLLKNFDWSMMVLTLITSAVGVILIYSATHTNKYNQLYWKQIHWIGVGLAAMILTICIDYRILAKYSFVLYFMSICALLYVLFFSQSIQNVKRWITIGSVSIQPSEFIIVAVVILLAKYFEDSRKMPFDLFDIIISGIFVIIPLVLILKEPDLGTAMLLIPIYLVIIFIAGFELRYLGYLVGLGLITLLILLLLVFWVKPKGILLKDYQKARMIAFLNPNADPLGSGYHIIQSKIAIGSGGFWGKGLLAGTQSQLKFLPVQHTDFIFSVLAEELGFIGSVIVLGLLFFILLKGIDTALKSGDRLGSIMAIGIVTIILIHILVNVGMVLGLLPITGLTLPLISYGGSSILATMVKIGLLINIRIRRFMV
ncbi:MAG: rod shape-determining protein RodA [bacterium]